MATRCPIALEADREVVCLSAGDRAGVGFGTEIVAIGKEANRNGAPRVLSCAFRLMSVVTDGGRACSDHACETSCMSPDQGTARRPLNLCCDDGRRDETISPQNAGTNPGFSDASTGSPLPIRSQVG